MKNTARKYALACTFLTCTGLAMSGFSTAGEPGGVVVDISNIDLHPDDGAKDAAKGAVMDSAGNGIAGIQTAATATADATAEAAAAAGAKAAAAGEAASKLWGNVVDAMTPEETVPPLANDRFELYLSEKVAFANYERTAERFNLDNGRMHVAFLHSEERDSIFQGGLALDTPLSKTFRLSFGSRAYVGVLSEENDDTFAAAMGAEAAYKLPFKSLPLEFGASIYYAPDILTFGVADRLVDTRFGVALPVRSQMSLFTGLRYLTLDTRPGNEQVDNRVHLGIRWDFM